MDTASDQSNVGPVMEVWGATLTRYLSAMGMVILYYDCLLTIEDEVCLIISRFGVCFSVCSADAPCLARKALLSEGPLLH
jgi:hypothetical protein